MNAKEARQLATFNKQIDRTFDIVNVLRIEIANAVYFGRMNCEATIFVAHDSDYVVDKLKHDGFNVSCKCILSIIGNKYHYSISW